MKRVYIACPYTHGDRQQNVYNCIAVADSLAEAGYAPFAPLLFHYWDEQWPHEYEFWIKQSMEWLEQCHAVLRLAGKSPGADQEVERAKELGIPVFYSVVTLIADCPA